MWRVQQVCTVWRQRNVSSCRSVRAKQSPSDLLYVCRVCIRTWGQRCGPRVYMWGRAPSGCKGGPWHLMGLQQCGGQAGTVSHFGYVHIRSRSMAPLDRCHFLRSNTQTWKNRKDATVRHSVTTFSPTRVSVPATSGLFLRQTHTPMSSVFIAFWWKLFFALEAQAKSNYDWSCSEKADLVICLPPNSFFSSVKCLCLQKPGDF